MNEDEEEYEELDDGIADDAAIALKKLPSEKQRRKREQTINPGQIKEEVLIYLEERFGLSRSLFDSYGLYLAPKGKVYLGPRKAPANIRIVTIGLHIARAEGAIKPTTNLFQVFGDRITKNVVSLAKEQVKDFVRGNDIQLPDTAGQSDGYVHVRYLDYDLGCAHLKGKGLKNMVPKAKRIELKMI
jgi:NOL1/NOP2/fmu family ribosome biogenesis protein